MLQRHLVILDVDGTLVHSLEAEALLFPKACEDALGLSRVSSDWESYRCPSDRGIVRELVEIHFRREAREEEYLEVEQRFLELIREYYSQDPGVCRPVLGANEAIGKFRQTADIAIAVATAGWHRTALHKLEVAGVSIQDIPMATSHDAERKVDIMRVAAERASEHYGVSEFRSVVCFGDSKGDAEAAAELGHEFIGIDTSGAIADERHTFENFGSFDDIMRTMRAIQGPRCVNLSGGSSS
jgi:phosphoglycolate phosphatase-like HAD superfamily hydrolase